MAEKADIRIDPEFRQFVPPLTEQERSELEEALLRDGCRAPLAIWQGHGVLLDGHHRLELCQEHDLPYKTVEVVLLNRDAAKVWIIKNQFGRRNLTPYQRAELALALKPLLAAEAKERQGRRNDLDSNIPKKSWESDIEKREQKEIARIQADLTHDYDVRSNLVSQAKQRYAKERRRRQMADDLQIYVAATDTKIKVGVSVDPASRMEELATSDPEIQCIAAFPGDRRIEAAAIKKFAAHSIGGEWFTRTPALLDEMCRYIKKESQRRNESSVELTHVAGVSHDTVHKVEYIAKHGDERTKERLRRGDTSINAAYKAVKKKQARRERAERKARRVELTNTDACRLICCNIADAARHVEPDSVDWIVTDPPYPRKHLPLFGSLGVFAAHALKPGGSLICMSGQSWLPEVYRLLDEHLDYHWTLAYLTPGGQSAQLWERRVNTFWKPLLWFTKGKYGGDWVGDVCRSDPNDNDKDHHHWGQSVSGMVDVLRRLASPGDTVCDPFVGGGATAVAASLSGCRFIGMDADEACLDTTRRRLHELEKEKSE